MVEGTKWLAVIFLIVVVACSTETIEKSEVSNPSVATTQSQISPTNTPVPTVEPTGEPTFTPTEIALLSTIAAMLEAEETSTPAPTSTPKPTITATSIPTATPQSVRQILPSLASTMAAEPQFSDLPVHIAGRCGDPIANLYTGFGCYFDDHNSAFFVNEDFHGCLYRSDHDDLPQCEAWLWDFGDFCIQRVEDVGWDYKWQFRLTCTTSPSGPTPTPIPESPMAEVEGLGHCQNEWFLVAGEGCLIRETTLFFWVTSDNDGCVIGEGLEEPDCFQRDYFKILQRGGHTIPINIQRGTDLKRGPGWRLYVVEPIGF